MPGMTDSEREECFIDKKAEVIKHLRTLFDTCDHNNDSCVDQQELADALSSEPDLPKIIEEAELHADIFVFHQLDINDDGKITWKEFSKMLRKGVDKEAMVEVKRVSERKRKDRKEKRELERREKEEQAKPKPPPVNVRECLTRLKEIFEQIDINRDGAVNACELVTAIRQHVELRPVMDAAGLNPEYFALEQFDSDEDGAISWREFEYKIKKGMKMEVEELEQTQTSSCCC